MENIEISKAIRREKQEKNLFNTGSEAIVNTVNCVGVMGAGVALEFRNRYQVNYALYKNACKTRELRIGKVFATEPTGEEGLRIAKKKSRTEKLMT